VLAFDYGERYTGIAVGDTAVRVAHPLATVDARASKARLAAIAEFVATWRPAHFVVGRPVSVEGEPHDLTHRTERFARGLQGRFGVPVTLIDERFSSAEAEERLRAIGRGGRKHKQFAHPVAAQVMLQDYFDRHAAP